MTSRHINAQRDDLLAIFSFVLFVVHALWFIFSLFLPYEQRERGGGGCCQIFSFYSLFPVQQTTSGIDQHHVKYASGLV